MLDVDHELQALTLRGRHQVPPRVSLPPSLPDYDPNSCFLTQSLPGFLRSIFQVTHFPGSRVQNRDILFLLTLFGVNGFKVSFLETKKRVGLPL